MSALTGRPPHTHNGRMDNTTQTEQDKDQSWLPQLQEHYDQAVRQFEQGRRGTEQVIAPEAAAFLDSIGTSARELYDFVEDRVEDGEPDFNTVAAITAVRRSYFLTEQQGRPSGEKVPSSTLPSGYAELGGYRWLPRIIAKARAKLRGELSPDMMFGCGADRPFLRSVRMEPAEFLRVVWNAGTDEQQILDAVQKKLRSARPSPDTETGMTEKIRKSDDEWKQQLTPDQYAVTRRQGTEPAFSGGVPQPQSHWHVSLHVLRDSPVPLQR